MGISFLRLSFCIHLPLTKLVTHLNYTLEVLYLGDELEGSESLPLDFVLALLLLQWTVFYGVACLSRHLPLYLFLNVLHFGVLIFVYFHFINILGQFFEHRWHILDFQGLFLLLRALLKSSNPNIWVLLSPLWSGFCAGHEIFGFFLQGFKLISKVLFTFIQRNWGLIKTTTWITRVHLIVGLAVVCFMELFLSKLKYALDFRLIELHFWLFQLDFKLLDSSVSLIFLCLEVKYWITTDDLFSSPGKKEIALYCFLDEHSPNMGISL